MGLRFKDFYIAVGQPGAYSENMVYDEVFGVKERFGIMIKHAPYSPMPKVKNMVVQSWKDEDGDDVWLPRKTSSALGGGTYEPAITHEAVDYNPKFVIFGDAEVMNSNEAIKNLIDTIEGRWLKIWDEYSQTGFEGVYLVDVDDDPKFKRRNYDYVEFELKFRINGPNIHAPFHNVTPKNNISVAGDNIMMNRIEVNDNGYIALDTEALTPITDEDYNPSERVAIVDGNLSVDSNITETDGYLSLDDMLLEPIE